MAHIFIIVLKYWQLKTTVPLLKAELETTNFKTFLQERELP